MTQIDVVRFKQHGYTLFSGVMTVGQLMDHAVPTEWDPEIGWDENRLAEQGYQRAPVDKHWRSIGGFLSKEQNPLLPTHALLASRNADFGILKFTPLQGALGHLEIPEHRRLFLVDYQHRWRGFRYAIEEMGMHILREVEIPVTILADTPLYEEMKQFYLINNKQKRVDTDLALTLIHSMAAEATEEELANLVGAGNRFRIRATRLVVRFLQTEIGPWAGRIQEPNMDAQDDQTASIKSFVDSLRPIVSTRSIVHKYSDDDVFELVEAVWDGILDLYQDWEASNSQYAVQRSVGLFVFHRVAAAYLIPEMVHSDDWSREYVSFLLSEGKSERLSRDFWRVGGGIGAFSSGAGQTQLAQLIVADLEA